MVTLQLKNYKIFVILSEKVEIVGMMASRIVARSRLLAQSAGKEDGVTEAIWVLSVGTEAVEKWLEMHEFEASFYGLHFSISET